MMRSQFLSTIALAAALGATLPAVAADYGKTTKSTGAQASQTTDSKSTSSLPSSATRSMDTNAKPDCSSFKNPNAGKLADKSTGAAKEHSASPVHMDCDDTTASTTGGTSGAAGSTTSGAMNGIDTFTQQALGILTSSRLADAIDLSKEDPKLVERYGLGDPKFRDDGAPKLTENFLIARRLVEAGARVVSMNFSRWDWHGDNFGACKQDCPLLDRGLSALIQDLHDRGLDKDVSVVVWGEFGRTPKINKDAGRDHWPQVSFALLAGGGMRNGQVIGATNRLGEYATERPVTFQEVFATLYHNIGLNLRATREFDLRGRPHNLVDQGVEPLKELI